MNAQCNVELRLLNDYLNAAQAENDPAKATQAISIYARQIDLCENLGCEFNAAWHEAMVYFLKAWQKLLSEGFFEKAARDTMKQSEGLDMLFPAFLARTRSISRTKEAIKYLDSAIKLYPRDPDFWLLRALSFQIIDEKQAALDDVNQILSRFGNDEEVYLKARKLKDEIESESGSGCFIATAVYLDYNAPEVLELRRFRDDVLLPSAVGERLVRIYYTLSPSIAVQLQKSKRASRIVKMLFLDPIVQIVKHTHH